MEMNVFTIKELENLSGVRAHTIRIWEQRYNFLKPNRTDSNIRYYCSQELKKVLNISLLNKYGYKISHIDKMSELEVRSKIGALSDREAQQERLINELIANMVDLEIALFERLLDTIILTRGIDGAITGVLLPFLCRIGILWEAGVIGPSQERLVTQVVRQKLIVGIEGILSGKRSDKTLLLFLPEGGYHELGLLYVYYLLKSNGIRVLYLGPDMPLKEVEFVCQARKPDYLYTHLTGIEGRFNLDKFVQHITQKINIPMILSGQLVQVLARKNPPGIRLCRSVEEIGELIPTL